VVNVHDEHFIQCVPHADWQYTDEEVVKEYEEFYEDVHSEFIQFGEIVNFKVMDMSPISTFEGCLRPQSEKMALFKFVGLHEII